MRQAKVTVEWPTLCGPVSTDSRPSEPVAPKLLARQFDVAQPDQVWGGDSPSIWTTEGGYLAGLPDLSARKVVGWALSHRVDPAFVQEALRMALGRRQPAVGLIPHSDLRSQEAGGAHHTGLAEHGLRWSLRRQGDCLDNVVAERFFGRLQGAGPSLHHGARRPEARDAVIAFIEMVYNSQW